MTRRKVIHVTLISISVAATLASAFAGHVMIAIALCASAIALWLFPSKRMSDADRLALLEAARLTQRRSAEALLATVFPTMMFIAIAPGASAGRQRYAVLLRDELEPGVWRELATTLRHPASDPQAATDLDAHPALRFGESRSL